MTEPLSLVLVDEDRNIIAAVKRLLRGAVAVIDFDDPRTALAYLSAIHAPVDILWTDLAFRQGLLGIQILDFASFRTPRPELLLVTSAHVVARALPKGTSVFEKSALRAPVARVEELIRVPRASE